MKTEIRLLESGDDRDAFRSGDEALDLFFHRYAGQNQFRHHVGVTYLAVGEERIVGFVTVAPATLDADALPGKRRMPPYPVPVLRLARLAVGREDRGRGTGRRLLRFVLDLAGKMRDELGCVGVVVDAKSPALEFYRSCGFAEIGPVEGASAIRPAPVPMFLPLGSVPRQS